MFWLVVKTQIWIVYEVVYHWKCTFVCIYGYTCYVPKSETFWWAASYTCSSSSFRLAGYYKVQMFIFHFVGSGSHLTVVQTLLEVFHFGDLYFLSKKVGSLYSVLMLVRIWVYVHSCVHVVCLKWSFIMFEKKLIPNLQEKGHLFRFLSLPSPWFVKFMSLFSWCQ